MEKAGAVTRADALWALGLKGEPRGLTEAVVLAARARPLPRRLWLGDAAGRGHVAGLGLLVTEGRPGPKGTPVPGAATYYVAARVGRSGPLRHVRVGRADVVSLAEARDKARTLISALHSGQDVNAHREAARAEEQRRVTVSGFLEGDYWKKHAKRLKSGEAERERLRTVWKPLHGLGLSEVTEESINAVLRQRLDARISHNTVCRDWTGIRSLLGQAVKLGALPALPFTGRPSALKGLSPRRRMRYLGQHAPDEPQRFLAALLEEDEAVQHAFALLALTGMRRSELVGLHKSEVRLHLGVIVLPAERTKSNRERTVRLNAQAVAVLERMKPDKSGAYFPGPVATWWTRLKRARGRICKKAGLPDFRLHDLRHHFATRARLAGAPLETVRELLGHADVRSTQIYAHVTEPELRQLVAKIEI